MHSILSTMTQGQLQQSQQATSRQCDLGEQFARPFACFRYACNDLGILQQWYDFKNKAEAHPAQEWLAENHLLIKDGNITRNSE